MIARAQLVLVGVGAIGAELLMQLASTLGKSDEGIRVCGLVDRAGYVFSRDGLKNDALIAIGRYKRSGGSLANCEFGIAADPLNAVAFIASQLARQSVLVDATAADTHAMLEIVLERGWDVVLANKVPIAAELARADALCELARCGGGQLLYEATVGAGLPVIDTVRKLLETGDRIRTIDGCPSGTLGFLFAELGRGERFSTAVRAAIAAGYTEPDPRLDLSGVDVARKALILARAIGFRGDLGDLEIDNLIPLSLRTVSLDEFIARLDELDDVWQTRVEAARERGRVLRYRAHVTSEGARVGLTEVPCTDPSSLLQGTDNQFVFTTTRYDTRPLVISGPGAGAAVTAAGVYSDVRRAIAERRASHTTPPS